ARNCRMHEDPNSFHIIIELLRRQRMNRWRHLGQRAIDVLFWEKNLDREFHLAFHRRRIEQNLMRRNTAADLTAGSSRKSFARGNKPRVRLPRDPLVPLPLLKMTKFGQPLVQPPRRAKKTNQQLCRWLSLRCRDQLLNERLIRQAKELIQIEI